MSKKIIVTAMLVSIIFISWFGYHRWVEPKENIKTAVSLYNFKLQQAMAESDPKKMLNIAALEQAQRVELDIWWFAKKKTILAPRLLNIEFLDIALDGDKAAVRTQEKWNQVEKDLATQKVKKQSVVTYFVTYSLQKQAGK